MDEFEDIHGAAAGGSRAPEIAPPTEMTIPLTARESHARLEPTRGLSLAGRLGACHGPATASATRGRQALGGYASTQLRRHMVQAATASGSRAGPGGAAQKTFRRP